jgi:dolichol-phosphate mannosyltransferase
LIIGCIVIPTYNEEETVCDLVEALISSELPKNIAIVISDDSEIKKREIIFDKLDKISKKSSIKILFTVGNLKAGRGAAVQRGFKLMLKEEPNCQIFIQCDADGSHRAQDILKILKYSGTEEVVIGSRYLADSKIQNWPVARRIFSRVLNFSIPRILAIECKDITNGLRRYNRKSVKTICDAQTLVSGFLALTEEILILLRYGSPKIIEIPTVFVNRIKGESSVTLKDLRNSLHDLSRLAKKYRV